MQADGDERIVRVFVSSPADVAPERGRVQAVAGKLNREFAGRVRFETVLWEEHFYTANRSFQPQIPDALACDIVVSIFWTRIGTELPADFPRMPTGERYPSGTAYELLTALEASKANNVPDVYVFRKTADATLPTTDAERRRQAQTQLDALEGFWSRWFKAEQGGFKAAFQTFSNTDVFEQQAEDLLRQWLRSHGLLEARLAWPKEKGAPFRGLVPFEAEHAAVFFGRDRMIDEGRRRLVATADAGMPFLLIVGASGAGKSSLARAGLIPRLTLPGVVPSVDLWRAVAMKPSENEGGPVAALAAALFAALPEITQGDFATPDALAAHLRRGGESAARPVTRALARAAEALQVERNATQPLRPCLALLVDQLEELFAPSISVEERAAFSESIKELTATGQIWCVATLRADFYELMLNEQTLKAMKQAGASLDLGPPGPAELAEIVRAPAAAAGLVFETTEQKGELADRLLADAKTSDSLPLLQFTLQQLYDRRVEGDGQTRLTHAAYEALGGLQGAIATRAETAFAGLPADVQAALPRLLRILVTIGRFEAQPTSRAAPIAQFAQGSPERALIDALLAPDVRLLIADDAQIRLAHEALITHWERASRLIAQDRDDLRIRAAVEQAEAEWLAADAKTKKSYLLRDPLLAGAADLSRRWRDQLPSSLRNFIESSVAAARAASRRRWALATAVMVFLALLTSVAVIGLYVAETQRNDALIGQSRFLARSAVLVVDNGSAESGALLALAALPADLARPERPFAQEAEYALAYAVANLRQELLIRGAGNTIWSAAFSPDGRQILVGSDHKTARLYDATSGAELKVFRADDAVKAVAFSPDGGRIGIGLSDTNIARVLDVTTGEVVAELKGGEMGVRSLAFSPDGKWLLTGSFDGAARLWDVKTAEVIAQFRHEGSVFAVAFAPDGTHVATAGADKTARIWDLNSKASQFVLKQNANVYAIAYSHNGKRIVTATGDGRATAWDAEKGTLVALYTEQGGQVTAAAFAPNGSIVSGGVDGSIRHWNPVNVSGVTMGAFVAHEATVWSVAVSPDGNHILTASADGTAAVWRMEVEALSALMTGHEGHVPSAQFSPNGALIATASADKTVRLWDGVSGLWLRTFAGHTAAVNGASFSGDGTRLVSASDDGTARVWDVAQGSPLFVLEHQGKVSSASFSPDGKRIVTTSEDHTARVWDAETGAQTAVFSGHTGPVTNAFFSPDGKRVATLARDNGARLWDVDTGSQIAVVQGAFSALALSPDGSHLVLGANNGAIGVWDGVTGARQPAVMGFSHSSSAVVSALALSPDGKQLVAGNLNGLVGVWELATGKLLAEVKGNSSRISSARFSPDGKRILTTALDRTARLYDAETGAPVLIYYGSPGPVVSGEFSPDGRNVLTASRNGARLWQMPLRCQPLIDRARAEVQREMTPNEKAYGFLQERPAQSVTRIYNSLRPWFAWLLPNAGGACR